MSKEKYIFSACTKGEDKFVVESAATDVPEGCMRLTGTFAVVTVDESKKAVNNNGRYYILENYRDMVNQMQKEINEGDGVFGELEHPKTMGLNWERVSHKVENISIDESTGKVTGSILVLGTPMGKIVQECYKAGMKPRISSRGRGVIAEDGKTVLSMMPTYDIVRKSGFEQATMAVCESGDGEIVMESFEVDVVETSSVGYTRTEIDALIAEGLKTAKNDIVQEALLGAKQFLNESSKDKGSENGTEVALESIQTWCESYIDSKLEAHDIRHQNFVHESMQKLGGAVQSWVVEQYSPQIQKWVVEHYSPEVQNWVTEQFAPQIENWIVEHYSPQIQNWVVEHYSPEVQKWLVEGYAPEIQKWVVEQYTPEIEKWAVEEFAPQIEKWVVEEFGPSVAIVETKAKDESEEEEEEAADDANDNLKTNDSKKSEKDAEEEVAEDVNESATVEKTLLQRIDEELQAANSLAETEINEAAQEQLIAEERKLKTQKLLSTMPQTVKYLFESCDETRKEELVNQGLMRSFTNDEQILEFWDSRFKSNEKSQAAHVIKAGNTINENLSNKIAGFGGWLK